MNSLSRWWLLIAAAAVVTGSSGCMKMAAVFTVEPSGGTRVNLKLQFNQIMGAAQGDPREGFASNLPDHWKVNQFVEDNWLVLEAEGASPPNTQPFPGDEAPVMEVTKQARRLSTMYHVTLKLPPGGMSDVPGGSASEMDKGLEEGLEQALMGIVTAGIELSFSLRGPGQLVATSGEADGPNSAIWRLGLAELQGGQLPEMSVTTELINWTHVGRLADQIALAGGTTTAAPALAEALERRLLPNPPLTYNPASLLGPTEYNQLLEIIALLDETGTARQTAAVWGELGLSRDDLSAARVQRIYQRVMAPGFKDRWEKTGQQALVKALSGQ